LADGDQTHANQSAAGERLAKKIAHRQPGGRDVRALGPIPARKEWVNSSGPTTNLLKSRVTNAELISGLRSALDQSYSRVLEAASHEWQRQFGGKDPSDSCVSVRISVSGQTQTRRLGGCGRMPRIASGAA
jgi:hypothetical protein